MREIEGKEDDIVLFDGKKLLSKSISSFIVSSACKIADILDFCKEQVGKAKFLIGEKKRFSKREDFVNKIDESIKLLEQSRKLGDIPGEETDNFI